MTLRTRIVSALRFITLSLCAASIVAAAEILNLIFPGAGGGLTGVIALAAIAGFLISLTMENGSDKLAAAIFSTIFSVIIYWIVILLPVELEIIPSYAVNVVFDLAFVGGFYNGLISFIPFLAGSLATLFVSR